MKFFVIMIGIVLFSYIIYLQNKQNTSIITQQLETAYGIFGLFLIICIFASCISSIFRLFRRNTYKSEQPHKSTSVKAFKFTIDVGFVSYIKALTAL